MAEIELTEASREGEQDDDLLTYTEVAIRLQIEIRKEREKLAAASGPEAEAIQERIETLSAAAERNRHSPVNDESFEHFFGFPSRTPVRQESS